MKTKTILISFIGLMAITALVFQACKKDSDNPTVPVYTNGQGEVGSAGGTVMIDDASSPINGARIVIPEGALESNVDISIQEAEITSAGGHENIIGVKFLPEGTVFQKEVEITIPWSTRNQTASNSRVYYLDETNSTIQQLEVKSVNTQSKQTTAYTSHFSVFFSDPDVLSHEIKLVKVGGYFAGYFNLQTTFDQIPAIINDGRNADDIINQEDGLENCTVRLIFELYVKDGWIWEEVADMAIYIDYDQWSSGWAIWVDKSNSSMGGNSSFQIFNKYGLDFNQMTSTWMSGYPFLAIFDKETFLDPDFMYQMDKNYKLTCTWGIVKDYNGFLKPWVWTWQYCYSSDKLKWIDVSSYNKDANMNNILDSYEQGNGENQPPNIPTFVSPQNYATNVSTNPILKWNCSDPDGDVVSYNVVYGTSYPPTWILAENLYDNQAQLTDLYTETKYYWYVDAMDDEFVTSGDIWEFTTGSGGGSGACSETINLNHQQISVSQLNNLLQNDGLTSSINGDYVYRVEINGGGGYYTETQMMLCTDGKVPVIGWAKGVSDSDEDNRTQIGTDPSFNNLFSFNAQGWVNVSNYINEDQQYMILNSKNGTNIDTYIYYWFATDQPLSNLGYGLLDTYDDDFGYIDVDAYQITGGGGTGSFTDPRDGQNYTTVDIGSQTWFAENLNYQTTNSWWYNNSSANGNIYGRLYTWDAALTACPSGWHLPNDEEWKTLEMALGMSQSEAEYTGMRGIDEGGKMKEAGTTHWDSPNTGAINTSAFTALPGGVRVVNGNFLNYGKNGNWWSSTEFLETGAWCRGLFFNSSSVSRNYTNKMYSYSIRCLKN